MKTKVFFFLAAMLLSVSAFAQSESTLKGDVNNDGTVDVADINAIIKIMKDGGGTAEQTTYYWYVGVVPPTDPTSTSENTGLNKWTSLGTSLPTSSIQVVKEDTDYNFHTWYIAAPADANFALYNVTNDDIDTWGDPSTITIGNILYDVWTSPYQTYQVGNYLHK